MENDDDIKNMAKARLPGGEDQARSTPLAPRESAAGVPIASPAVTAYVQAALAARSRQAYREDLARFLDRGGTVPATPEEVANYLAAHAATHAVATLARWTVSLGRAHTTQGLANPCKTELVRTTLKGIRRTHGAAPRQVAPALRDDLIHMVRALGNRTKDRRDRALLLIGFAGAFRRAELVALTVGDVAFSDQGATITIRRAKTDQEARGRTVGIPFARGAVCPVKALQRWLEHDLHGAARAAPEAALFRAVNRHGQVADKALSAHAVALIVKARCLAVGLDPARYSGHSLRAGFCTSAALAGAPHWKIKKQSGHKTNALLDRYIRDARLFADNPLEGLF
jgi:integrase